MIQINKSVLRDRGTNWIWSNVTNSIKFNKYEQNFKGLVYHKIEIVIISYLKYLLHILLQNILFL